MNYSTSDKTDIALVPLISVETALARYAQTTTRLIIALVISACLQFAAWSVALSMGGPKASSKKAKGGA